MQWDMLQQILIDERRKDLGKVDVTIKVKKKQNPRSQRYGEIDRPESEEVVAKIKDRFADWDNYKMKFVKNLIRCQQKKKI